MSKASMSGSDSGSASSGLAFDKMQGLGNDFVMVLLDDLLAVPPLVMLSKGINPACPPWRKGFATEISASARMVLLLDFS